jgi:hypothetical protein
MEKYNLFDEQPESCRQPLPYKELPGVDAYLLRIMFFDPTEVYQRVSDKINPFERYNWQQISFLDLFPDRTDGKCSCGCGEVLRVGKRRWATKDCQMFAINVWNVIGGRQEFIGFVFEKYFGNRMCMKCGEAKWVDIDHIHPVSHGGGGCWLSNFQALCKKCHKEKTRSDFNWTKLKTTKDE